MPAEVASGAGEGHSSHTCTRVTTGTDTHPEASLLLEGLIHLDPLKARNLDSWSIHEETGQAEPPKL